MKPLDLLLERLGKYERRNGYYMASCPAHEDPNASLGVSGGDDGRALLRCFAGCETSDIVAQLGLGMRDLFPPTTDRQSIRDVKGELQAVHVRFDRDGGKDCLWLLPGASEWGLKGRKLPTLPS